jgi:peptide/nickel transport system ATP-binding protein
MTDIEARPLLDVQALNQEFAIPGRGTLLGSRQRFQAVAGVSFDVGAGETVGIVGETGCGKSTLARAIVQSPKPHGGRVLLDGVDLTRLRGAELRHARRDIQLVFQDPYSSLDPRWHIIDQVAEPLRIHGIGSPDERRQRASELLARVGLDPDRIGSRRPREVSGGECQRVVIARALTLSPRLLILDEPVSSLDVSVQAQVLNLLEELRAELGLAYVFISHDLSVVKHVSDRVVVMYLGKFCEIAPASAVYSTPYHHYSAELIASIPDPRVQRHRSGRNAVEAEIPSPADAPSGCRFRTRCPAAQSICAEVEPELEEVAPGHFAACHFPLRPTSVAIGRPSTNGRPAVDSVSTQDSPDESRNGAAASRRRRLRFRN